MHVCEELKECDEVGKHESERLGGAMRGEVI
jgi:hypothetical protein